MDGRTRMLCALALAALACPALAPPGKASAGRPRPIPSEAWTGEARANLAAALRVEGGNAVDRRAIPWTLARRWRLTAPRQGWSFAELIHRYSRPLALGRVEVPKDPTAEEVSYLDAWAAGDVPDPCPSAAHWAALCPAPGRACVEPRSPRRVCLDARNGFVR